MRTLILMRHAKAARAHEAPRDEARGLTERGRRDAEAAGAALAEAGLAPALALISSALRTRETAAHALKGLVFGHFAMETRFEDALYNAAPEGVWDAFSASEAACVIVIGHNPGLGELASHLIRQAHDGSKLAREFAGNFPTAAFAAFEIRGDLMAAAGPRLVAAWTPPRGEG